jgi:hypothetical protein
MNLHNLVMICLAVAYLSAKVYAIVKMRAFELARSHKHLLLYAVPIEMTYLRTKLRTSELTTGVHCRLRIRAAWPSVLDWR